MFDEILKYEGNVIRPPSEARSVIFQVTVGCTDNNCIFCPAYKGLNFRIKDVSELEEEFRKISRLVPETRRIFFADGDAITVPQEKLLKIFDLANKYFKNLSRIALYASAKSLKTKSVQDLIDLKQRKLGIAYIGVETGDEEVYRFIKKHGSPEEVKNAILKVKNAGIKTNVTVILGLGGKQLSERHAMNTAKLLNEAQPDQIAALTLMIVPGTPLHKLFENNKFCPLSDFEFVEELKTLVENLEDFPCLFFANHASNYVPIEARFPKQKAEVLNLLYAILEKKTKTSLKPEWLRGL
jgi:radical SAM superfamily enzyme YgiQ (UPF0313 family)